MSNSSATGGGRTKRPALRAALSRLALRLGPNAQLPTVRELAARHRVSLATLDRALAQLEQQGRIIRRPGSGIFTSSQVGQKTFAVVFGKSISYAGASPFWGLLLRSLRQQARARGCWTESYFDFDSALGQLDYHGHVLQQLQQRGPDGVLLTNVRSAEDADELAKLGVPLVVLGTPVGRHPTVRLDGSAVIRDGVAALASRGCRRIGLMTTRGFGGVAQFRAEVEARGLAFDPHWVWEQNIFEPSDPDEPFETHEEAGYRAMKQWLGAATLDTRPTTLAPLPDGIVITDDMLTRGALVALRKAGLQPGRDVQIATHANKGSTALLGYEDDLIRMEFDPEEIARAMLGMLEGLLAGMPGEREPEVIKPRTVTGAQKTKGSGT
jgi:DNA-binding LacI/PurR family transcriptional regulator